MTLVIMIFSLFWGSTALAQERSLNLDDAIAICRKHTSGMDATRRHLVYEGDWKRCEAIEQAITDRQKAVDEEQEKALIDSTAKAHGH